MPAVVRPNPVVDASGFAPRRCEIDPSCVTWTPPNAALCDPCYNPADLDHVSIWDAAWRTATSYLFDALGCQWPGGCFTETIRPCATRRCWCRKPSCDPCGMYTSMVVETCLPIVGIEHIWIGPNLCRGTETAQLLTPGGGGIRVEYVDNEVRVVRERDACGCCPDWPSQDLCYPTGSENTWHMTVHTGLNPPPHVLAGAVELATEIFQDCAIKGCRPPGNVTSKTFDGTSIGMDPELPVSMVKRLLQKTLDEVDDRIVEQFVTPGQGFQFHRVDGPRPVDTGTVCQMGCDSSWSCGCSVEVISGSG